MALSEEQQALMRLVAQPGTSHQDVAALMGISVEEVQARIDAALGDMGSAESEAAPETPAPRVPATAKDRPSRPRKPRRPLPRPRIDVSDPRRRFAAAAAAAAALIGLFVLLVFLIGGSGDSSTTATVPAEGEALSANVTQANLEPADGGEGSGQAIFGRIGNNLVLQVQAEGLEPTPEGSSYAIWLYRSPKVALRVGSTKVDETGGLGVQLKLPNEVLNILASGIFDEVDVSLVDDAAYKAEIAAAKKQQRLPAYSGTTVLSGPITGQLVEQ